jgi:hypothetical protein
MLKLDNIAMIPKPQHVGVAHVADKTLSSNLTILYSCVDSNQLSVALAVPRGTSFQPRT